jgi:hypothetical protein
MGIKISYLAAAFLLGSASLSIATPEISSTQMDQKAVVLTIYNQNRALVKDLRTITVPKGGNVLAFKEVSAKIEPETALFSAPYLAVLEQNFEYDLLTPQSLLHKYIGREVLIVKTHPTTGEESSQAATVLAANGGVVLKVGDQIETDVPGRLIFPDLPKDLRDQPTLTMLVESASDKPQDVSLSYLTTGLNWKTDYVAELNDKETALDLDGWVTLNNQSGASFNNASLRLVAGDVQQLPSERKVVMLSASRAGTEMDSAMSAEEMFEYHLYTLDRPTTIKDGQTKQVALLSGENIGCNKEFVLQGSGYYYTNPSGTIGEKLKVEVFLHLKNSKQNRLGMVLPKGIVRVYKKDGQGNQQFIGEDRIAHTPENEIIRLKLGNAFDLTADKTQTDFKRLPVSSKDNPVYEVAFKIELKNAKKEPVTIQVVEPIPGDWQIIEESLPHEKKSGNIAAWLVRVPPQSTRSLTYRARLKM